MWRNLLHGDGDESPHDEERLRVLWMPQISVPAATDNNKTSADLGQGSPQSAKNIQVGHCGDSWRSDSEDLSSYKLATSWFWERLDSQLLQELVTAFKQRSPFEDIINIFGEVVYCHCLRVFGCSKRKSVACTKQSRGHKRFKELRKRKNVAKKQFKRAGECEKEGLHRLWRKLTEEHSVLCRAERFGRNRRRTRKVRERFFKVPFQFARTVLEQPRSSTPDVETNVFERHLRHHIFRRMSEGSLAVVDGLSWPVTPTVAFNRTLIIREVSKVVHHIRAVSPTLSTHVVPRFSGNFAG